MILLTKHLCKSTNSNKEFKKQNKTKNQTQKTPPKSSQCNALFNLNSPFLLDLQMLLCSDFGIALGSDKHSYKS